VVSKSRIWGARRKGLSGVEGLLAVVGLEMTTEGVRTGTGTERWRKIVTNFRGCNATTTSAKNDVRANGATRRLVLECLRERVE